MLFWNSATRETMITTTPVCIFSPAACYYWCLSYPTATHRWRWPSKCNIAWIILSRIHLAFYHKKQQLNWLGYGYAAIFAQVLNDGRAQIFNPSHKTTNNQLAHEFYNEFKSLLSLCDKCNECIVFSDFKINWMDRTAKGKLKSATGKFKYAQLIDKPTRITRKSKTLDFH